MNPNPAEGKRTRLKKGLVNGAYHYGYCNGRCTQCTDPNGPGYCPRHGQADLGNGYVIVPHPLESIAVRLIFEWYATGELAQALRRLLGYKPSSHTATETAIKPIKRSPPPKSQREPTAR